MINRPHWIFAAVGVLGLAAIAVPGPNQNTKPALNPKRVVNFNRDVKPILSDHCFKCHGPATKDVAGGLRLDVRESAVKDMGGYFDIKPGDPKNSFMLDKINHENPKKKMPPVDSGVKPLTKEQIETLTLWIEQGAKYEKHWALMPAKMPSLPTVINKGWVKNDVDLFVLKTLENAGLPAEAEADRYTLIRRVSLTLTGLPPSVGEINAFVNDKSPKAYENMVDRYLASKKYGENQARSWLDAVRYGDTHGLHLDNERAIYPYRDWVVRAFNDDLGFNDFALWQLAGDMLPNPTQDQLVATGYIRMNPTSGEGGAIEEEFLARNTFDRVDTTGTVFLGMSIGCARCHDHKYDPVTQKDYYGLYAFFNSTNDSALDANALNHEPTVLAPSPEQSLAKKQYEAELKMLTSKVDVKAAAEALTAKMGARATATNWESAGPYVAKDYKAIFDEVSEAEKEGGKAEWKPIKVELGKPLSNPIGKDYASLYVRAKFNSPTAGKQVISVASDDGIKVWVNGKLVHSNMALRGISEATDKVTVDFKAGENVVLFKVVNATGADGFRVTAGDPVSDRISAVLVPMQRDVQPTPDQIQAIQGLYLEVIAKTPESDLYRQKLKNYNALNASIPRSLIAEELPKPRQAFVLRRGEYNLPTDKVERHVPAGLGSMPAAVQKNRLELAKWLTSPDQPLTPRVFVNRIWQQHFGTGIVKTAEDFGNQGEWPSHPELLDYLTVKFIENGWSVKSLHRIILNSAAFRQKAVVTAKKKEKDPDNRLISRGPRFRLDAEVLRDQALYVSGILNQRIGGRGFKPYQPSGLWEAIAFAGSDTARYVQDTGKDIYRRSLYMFWKRTSPHPIMLAFDAPMREACVVRRSRTNTPLQALVTLNETAFFEAARMMGESLTKGTGTVNEKLSNAIFVTWGRKAKPEEITLLANAYNRYKDRYANEKAEAEEVISVGELPRDKTLNPAEHAAWTLIASTLMNTDEFLTQH